MYKKKYTKYNIINCNKLRIEQKISTLIVLSARTVTASTLECMKWTMK